MKEKIKDILEPGEEILWSAQPAAFKALDKTHKNYYIRRSIIVAIAALAVFAAYFYAAISAAGEIKWGVVAVLLALTAYAALSPVMDINKLRKCSYVLTNEKLLLVSPGDVRSVKLSSIPTAKIVGDEDGQFSLLCGPLAEKLPAFKRRVITLSGAMLEQSSGMCDRFVLYAIGDVQGLRKAAEGYLTIA